MSWMVYIVGNAGNWPNLCPLRQPSVSRSVRISVLSAVWISASPCCCINDGKTRLFNCCDCRDGACVLIGIRTLLNHHGRQHVLPDSLTTVSSLVGTSVSLASFLLPDLGRLAGGQGLGIIHALVNRGSTPWIADGWGNLVKYLIGSMNSSYDCPCRRFASASWVSVLLR